AVEAARENHEAARPVALGKGSGAPRWLAAVAARLDPNLEDAGRFGLAIVLGVPDAAARAHHLHVAGLRASLVAEAVLMGDGAVGHIGDDLHVGVGMRGKAGLRRDLVVVPHPQRAPAHALGIVVPSEGEMVLGLEPAMVRAAELFEWSYFDHDVTLL